MDTIEAKLYLLQAPGVNRVIDMCGDIWESDENGVCFFGTKGKEMDEKDACMHEYAPFTKVEPEKTNRDLARELHNEWQVGKRSTWEMLLDAVDDKIRRVKV